MAVFWTGSHTIQSLTHGLLRGIITVHLLDQWTYAGSGADSDHGHTM